MTDIKYRDLVKLLESEGFVFVRKSRHAIYKKNQTTIAIPNSKTIKRNTFKQIQKSIESA